MKVRKYPELNKLKGKFRELGLSYRKISDDTGIPLNRLNDKLNGYSQVGLDEALLLCEEAKISFDSHEEYIDTCEYCIQRFGKKVRLTFSFTEEEFELMKETAQKNSFINMVDFIITVLYALAMQGKTYEISLKEFSYFFFNKDKQVQITIPFEIMEKLNRTSFKKNQQTYFRKAMFWQIYFGKTLPIRYEEEDYFRVTPQKTGWFKTLFQCSDIIKNYARNKNLGSTENVAILNTLNTYLDQTVGEEVEEAEKETVVKEAVYD